MHLFQTVARKWEELHRSNQLSNQFLNFKYQKYRCSTYANKVFRNSLELILRFWKQSANASIFSLKKMVTAEDFEIHVFFFSWLIVVLAPDLKIFTEVELNIRMSSNFFSVFSLHSRVGSMRSWPSDMALKKSHCRTVLRSGPLRIALNLSYIL